MSRRREILTLRKWTLKQVQGDKKWNALDDKMRTNEETLLIVILNLFQDLRTKIICHVQKLLTLPWLQRSRWLATTMRIKLNSVMNLIVIVTRRGTMLSAGKGPSVRLPAVAFGYGGHGGTGFVLTEVLLAMAVIGIALTPLFGLQSNMLRSITRVASRIQRLFLAEDFLQNSRATFLKEADTQESKQEKKIVDPATALFYDAKAVKDESAFKSLPGILQEQTEMQWQDGVTKRREILVTYIYKPEKKKT